MYIEIFFESGSHCATQSDLKLTLSASVCLLRLRQTTPYLVNMIFSYAQQRVTMIEHTYLSLHVALLLCVATTSKIYSCQKKNQNNNKTPNTKTLWHLSVLPQLDPAYLRPHTLSLTSSHCLIVTPKSWTNNNFCCLVQLCKLNCIF